MKAKIAIPAQAPMRTVITLTFDELLTPAQVEAIGEVIHKAVLSISDDLARKPKRKR